MECPVCGAKINPGDKLCRHCGNDELPNVQTLSAQKDLSANGMSGEDIFSDSIRGVLEIESHTQNAVSLGSGLLVSGNGYALTNAHVVTESGKKNTNIKAKLCGESIEAELVELGDNNSGHGNGIDLALLKLKRVPASARCLKFGNSGNVKNGETVYVIGNSKGEGTCITRGIVSDKLRKVGGRNLIMTDCAVNPGNSGGPMFNDQSEVIGVVVSGYVNAEGMNFAIPSNSVKEFLAACSVKV